MELKAQAEIIRRLRCAARHLETVTEMTEAGGPCHAAQLLLQLNVVRAALRAARIRLILCQAQNSQAIILDSPSSEQRVAELKQLQSLYTIFVKYSNYNNEVIHD